MRQVNVQVPRGAGDEMAEVARDVGATVTTRLEGRDHAGEPVDVLLVTVPNEALQPLVDHAAGLGDYAVAAPAAGAYVFRPPLDEAPGELVDVSQRSSAEVVLAGLQAAGSWWGFLTFAAAAGLVVWLAFHTETVYLLTGSMLIAPFAEPAINSALSVVSGRPRLMAHSVARYGAGIAVTALTAGIATVIAGQAVVPSLMASTLTISAAAVVLPLVAGVAAAVYLIQSEHSSLISGAAVGVLVAASLAPPAGGLGMAVALGRFDLAAHAVFVIALQLTGITTTAVAVFWIRGVRPGTTMFESRRPSWLGSGFAVALGLTVALVLGQQAAQPALVQGTRVTHATEAVEELLSGREGIGVLTLQGAVASTDLPGPPRVIVDVVVERGSGAPPATELEAALTTELRRAVAAELQDVVVLIDVTVLDPSSV